MKVSKLTILVIGLLVQVYFAYSRNTNINNLIYNKGGATVQIRKATYEETQRILNHSLEVLKEATMGHVKPSKKKAFDLISPFLSNGGYYLICLEKNRILGWIGVGSSVDNYTDEMIGVILEIYVLPHYRNKGIAKKLCYEAFKYLNREGLNRVQLNVFSGNRAKKLYEEIGFKEVSSVMERKI
ncbi:GNAT family N-acetyltransferase [Bacillus sp. JJ1533]|uniref:GNAT family N-acetyltransferase n=1 Tax=Bacillus sp. JJ1533 TaxID=3122959 RepID=UPI002FFDCA61